MAERKPAGVLPADHAGFLTLGGNSVRMGHPSSVRRRFEPTVAQRGEYVLQRDPDRFPPPLPATSLSSEPHSFSRVFTGAFSKGRPARGQGRPRETKAAVMR